MRVLGFDTATAATSVALLDLHSGEAVERRDDPPAGARPRHTTRLLELVDEVLRAAGAGWPDVDRIAVGIGPGTFTGVRIGVSTARGLAAARELPISGVSTLEALALGAVTEARDDDVNGVLAVLDARRGELFAAGYAPGAFAGPPAPARIAPRAESAAALAAELTADLGRWIAVGPGARLARAELESAGALVPEEQSPLHLVDALQHCRLAAVRIPGVPDDVRPEYLREPDAVPARRDAPARS